MNFERFESEFSSLDYLFRNEGFYNNPDEYEKDVFGKFLTYYFEVKIIVSRLEEEITHHDSLIKSVFWDVKHKKDVNEDKMKEWGMTSEKIRLDLSDFYIYTRIFLDTLTVCIKLSFKRVGNKKWDIMKNSVKCLLNEKKMQVFKKEIDSDFFEGLEKKVSWISNFKDSRDKLLHRFSRFVFTLTRKGGLGYDIMDRTREIWGTNTVKGILIELQNIIYNLSDLMEYLANNLPRTS